MNVETMSVIRAILPMTCRVFLVVLVLRGVSAQMNLDLSPASEIDSMEDIEELIRKVQLLLDTDLENIFPEGTVPHDDEDVENNFAADEDDGENDVRVREDDGENDVGVREYDGENDVGVREYDGENDVGVGEEGGEKDVTAIPNGCGCSNYRCYCCKRIRMRRYGFDKYCCISLNFHPRIYGIRITVTMGRRTLFRKEISARNPPAICFGVPYVKVGVRACIQFNHLSIRGRRVSGCYSFLIRLFRFTILKVKLGCFRFNAQNVTHQIGEVEFPFLDEPGSPVEGPEPIYLGEILMDIIKSGDHKKRI